MTPTHLTYPAAQEHMNDLLRGAERGRQVGEVRPAYRVSLSLRRLFARRASAVVELEPAAMTASSVPVHNGN